MKLFKFKIVRIMMKTSTVEIVIRQKVLIQLTFTCSKLTIETLKQVRNMFKVNNKDTRTTPLASFWCFYC